MVEVGKRRAGFGVGSLGESSGGGSGEGAKRNKVAAEGGSNDSVWRAAIGNRIRKVSGELRVSRCDGGRTDSQVSVGVVVGSARLVRFDGECDSGRNYVWRIVAVWDETPAHTTRIGFGIEDRTMACDGGDQSLGTTGQERGRSPGRRRADAPAEDRSLEPRTKAPAAFCLG
jgi:hypothetical protein